jgi:hypothetical protein
MIVIIYTININYFPTLSPHTQKNITVPMHAYHLEVLVVWFICHSG